MTIKEISYEDERLGFFADQRKLVQKRYDRLEKQIKPDEPYLSERRQSLYDCGRELSFYNDVIEMLEDDVISRRQVERLEKILDFYAIQYGTVKDQQKVIDKAKSEVAKEIFEEIKNKISEDINDMVEYVDGITDPDALDGKYETIAALEWALDSVNEIEKKYVID